MATKKREKQLLELKETLTQERKKILDHLRRLEKESDEESPMTGDMADVASFEISQAALKKLGGREAKLLKKIDYALSKFENGTYGICELTGEDIPIERLRARPVALYTVEAKEELERKEKRFKDRGGMDDDDTSLDSGSDD